MIILAVDPGSGKSAAVKLKVIPGQKNPEILSHEELDNPEFLEWLWNEEADLVMFECLASNGGASQEVVDTAYWVGRFWTACEYSGKPVGGFSRRVYVRILFGTEKANDSKVVHYCCAAYGTHTPQEAKGTKKAPGPLYGITTHKWQALGLGLATIKALRTGKIAELYWDPMQTSSKAFRDKKTARREAKKKRNARRAEKGQKGGNLTDALNGFLGKDK